MVINFVVADEIVVSRLSNRRVCKKCGAIYNLASLPPKIDGVCDQCGGELYQRRDDQPEAIKKRLETYEKDTVPLIKHYKEKGLIFNIETKTPDETPDVVVARVLNAIGFEE